MNVVDVLCSYNPLFYAFNIKGSLKIMQNPLKKLLFPIIFPHAVLVCS